MQILTEYTEGIDHSFLPRVVASLRLFIYRDVLQRLVTPPPCAVHNKHACFTVCTHGPSFLSFSEHASVYLSLLHSLTVPVNLPWPSHAEHGKCMSQERMFGWCRSQRRAKNGTHLIWRHFISASFCQNEKCVSNSEALWSPASYHAIEDGMTQLCSHPNLKR